MHIKGQCGCGWMQFDRKMPKFRGSFYLPFQDIINTQEVYSLETMEHVYQRVECHIFEDHNVSFHSSKGCSTDDGKA
jgi:hypothetical protein